jgi:hypothetical protein
MASMSNLDIKNIASSLADSLADYLTNFLGIIQNPSRTVDRFLFIGATNGERKTLQGTLFYTTVSIIIGLCLAEFMHLPGEARSITPNNIVSIIFVWILFALVLHPLLKLFKGKGTVVSTIAVFLLVVSTLQVVFVPSAKIMSLFITKTEVILTYDYAIYGGGLERRLGNVESYLLENEPEKEGTVLVPYDKRDEYAQDRISVDESPYPDSARFFL